jgi:hypothetical protein
MVATRPSSSPGRRGGVRVRRISAAPTAEPETAISTTRPGGRWWSTTAPAGWPGPIGTVAAGAPAGASRSSPGRRPRHTTWAEVSSTAKIERRGAADLT